MPFPASLLVLTLPFYGIQSVWTTEMAFAPPYLLSLGLSRDVMSLVLLAGPFSGLLVQPLIGHHADNSTSKYGRRRPYILVGTVTSTLALFWLGYGKPVFNLLFGEGSTLAKVLIIATAVLSVYIVDFSVNAVMAVDRALLVDVLPADEQELANAWASRMVQFGSIAGYWIGSIDLPTVLPFFGSSQIQGISAVTMISLVIPHVLAILRVKEEPQKSREYADEDIRRSPIDMIKGLLRTVRDLPTFTHETFRVQFWSWLSQFPAVIYTTVYIGDIYRQTHPDSTDVDAGTRAGSRAMFYEAIVGLATITLIPLFLQSHQWGPRAIWKRTPPRVFLCAVWASSQLVSAFVMLAFSFSDSVRTATFFISINGFCMTVNHWVPFSLVGEAILLDSRAKQSSNRRQNLDEDGISGAPEEPLLEGASEPDPPMSAGTAMGILNAFICIPQFLVIALASILFRILEPHRTLEAHDIDSASDVLTREDASKDERSITLMIVFRLATVFGLIAFYLAIQLTKKLREQSRIWDAVPARNDDGYNIVQTDVEP